jgi:hypothetical protein
VHQVGRAGDRRGRKRQRLEQCRLGSRRRRNRYAAVVVEVVGEPYGDAALRGSGEGVLDDGRELIGEPDVVDGDLEGALRGADPVGERVRCLLCALAAVGERAKLYRAALCAAL